jgi:GTPase SAR1 family protein
MSEMASQSIPGLQQKKLFKIIVLGDSGVGKTCLTFRFCEGQFLDKSEATIGVDIRERSVRIGYEDIKVFLCTYYIFTYLYSIIFYISVISIVLSIELSYSYL